ncbi:hypothetical protein JCM9140_305 [Halalkalibacter wakoensis JCM 9140]|uniref:Spore coat protein F n=1 Tax=Halalkalibacter wakoensis JCM 9140 TaxID=1236970 RepID=W4PXD1_9BACI|nr:hypothetical protein [Halalkalibacter wakoensis]GAE24387.1 hypothetical protein JCM9140_305 [Halalkalibacter wakoensis JCM 9140]
MESTQYGIHEITDMRELINFKWACLIQSQARLEQVENPDLKMIIEHSITQGTTTVSQMKDILSRAATQMNQ